MRVSRPSAAGAAQSESRAIRRAVFRYQKEECMTQASSNTTAPEQAPDKGEAAQTESKDVPELEPFDEDDFAAAFAQLEEPSKS